MNPRADKTTSIFVITFLFALSIVGLVFAIAFVPSDLAGEDWLLRCIDSDGRSKITESTRKPFRIEGAWLLRRGSDDAYFVQPLNSTCMARKR